MPTFLETGNNLERTDLHITAGKELAVKDLVLAIVLTADGYSFCTAGGNPFVLSRLFAASYPEKWQSWMPGEQFSWLQKEHPELKAAYKRIHIALESSRSTLLPTAVYREGTGTDYFELVFGRVENEQLHRDSLAQWQSELISAFPIGYSAAVALHFSQAKLFSTEAVMGMRWFRQLQELPEQLFVHLQHEQLLVWHFQNEKLQLANRYQVAAPADVLYFLSLISNHPQCQVMLSGESSLLAEAHALLGRYYADLQWLGHDPLLAFDPQWSNLPPASWQALFACLCAS